MTEEQNTVVEEIKANAKAGSEANADAEVVPQGDKMLAAIGYFSFLCVLPLILKPDSEFCQFHGKQGLAITIIFLVFSVFLWLFTFFMPGLYSLLGLMQFLVAAYGIFAAFKGEMRKIPFVSTVAEKFEW